MKLRQNQWGSINILLIPLILACLFFFGAAGFAAWAYTERQDYKDNVDQKIAAAVKVAEQRVSSEKDNEFVEREKRPLKDFKGPALYGDISFEYPKIWSVYSEEKNNSMTVLLHPGVVSGNENAKYAIKLEVLDSSYEDILRRSEGDIKSGEAKAQAFRLRKLPEILGTRIDGLIDNETTGSSVTLPLRDKTIILRTESPEYSKDFNEIILPSFSFRP